MKSGYKKIRGQHQSKTELRQDRSVIGQSESDVLPSTWSDLLRKGPLDDHSVLNIQQNVIKNGGDTIRILNVKNRVE